MITTGINGFGRIGRMLLRVSTQRSEFDITQINDLADIKTLAHLLKYDSVHGHFPGNIEVDGDYLLINGSRVLVTHGKSPDKIRWKDATVVVDATGRFKDRSSLEGHLKSARRVILSAPAADAAIPMVVLGINDHVLDSHPDIVSNASCTTNCAAPMIEVIHRNFGVEYASITTVHSYTGDQRLHDAPHADLRRARAAGLSMVPTTTGAAKALTHIFPELSGKIGGFGIRVPVPNGSLTDITFTVSETVSREAVNQAFKKASEGYLKSILGYTADPIVSADIIGLKDSCLIDEQLTSVLGSMVKVVGWYDNEVGYSNRLADLVVRCSSY